jgi:uncharacterized protein
MKISIKVVPNAKKNQIIEYNNGLWRIKIAAPPDKGKANKELVEYLRKILKVKKNQVAIISGHTSHSKIIDIDGVSEQDIYSALSGSMDEKNKLYQKR